MKLSFKIVGFLVLFSLLESPAKAQLTPLAAQYYQNKYLANPAMAGIDGGMRLNVGFRNQQSSIKGSWKNTSVTADFRLKNVGIGVNLYKDEAGLLDRTKMVATYAYHLDLNQVDQKLHFGLSLGIQRGNLNVPGIEGDAEDAQALEYNARETIIDGDFGIAYTFRDFTLEGAFINAKKQLRKEDPDAADYTTFYAAASYVFIVNESFFTPKVAYRGIRNYVDVWDVGAELKNPTEQLAVSALYHSTHSFTLGLSYLHNNQIQLIGLYNSPTSAQKAYSRGSFEIGLQLRLFPERDY
ncbi:MAG: PorP/SprF family type IX secretion system membrane protein [Sphingobacteriaceae bacterium]